MVQEGKLSPEDAAELIDAFSSSEGDVEDKSVPPPPPPGSTDGGKAPGKDSFKSFIDYVENIGRDLSDNVNWQDVATQVRTGAQKGIESLKEGIEKIKKEGKFSFDLFSAHEVRTIDMPLSIKKGKTLRVENPVGDVRIEGGADAGSIVAKAKVRGMDAAEAKARAAEYTLIVEESDANVLIKQPDVSGIQVDLVIKLPDGVHIDARTSNGQLRVWDTKAGCKVAAASGDIVLHGLNGAIEVVSQSGGVMIEDSKASTLTIENKSGDVEILRVRGPMNIRTASGDLMLKDSWGKSLSIESVSGDVVADLSEPISGAVSIRTVNGASSVGIVDGSDCRVSLSTLRGQVVCSVPLEEESKSDMHASGVLGEGSGTLDVSAVNGSISLKFRDQTA